VYAFSFLLASRLFPRETGTVTILASNTKLDCFVGYETCFSKMQRPYSAGH
jgi:hypothetical protein